MSYFEVAQQYVDDVLTGKEIACKYVKQACQRQRDDLDRANFPYQFDVAKAERVCKFVELFTHIKGELSGHNLKLEPWQVFILTTLFGWVDNEGFRRFKIAHVEVARKNGKSTLIAALALYMAFADGEGGAECYAAATTGDQARIVFDVARQMAIKSPAFRARFGVSTTAHTIYQTDGASMFRPVNAEASTLDGLNTHFASMDELHAHKTRKLWDVIETSMGARRHPLMFTITTAGSNRSGICYEQRVYVTKILSQAANDDEYFGIIYTLDDEDLKPENRDSLFHDENLWRKANPNYGVSVRPNDMRRLGRKALQMTAAQNNFMTKRLDVWVNADVAWMDMPAWERCANHDLHESEFSDEECVQALDLAYVRDICARVRVYRRMIMPTEPTPKSKTEDRVTPKPHYFIFGNYYLPEITVDNTKNSQYQGWDEENRLTVTEGATTDLTQVENDIYASNQEMNILMNVFDPHQATQMMQNLEKVEVPVDKLAQNRANFSEPMKEMEAAVLDGRLHHNGCPIMTWMVSNTVANINDKEECYPKKETEDNKIDGVVAVIMCIRRWIDGEEDQPTSAYEERGLRQI